MFKEPWIDVNDALPKHLQPILFCFKNGTGEGAWYKYPTTMYKGDFFRESPTEGHFRMDCHNVNDKQVACWMPVPPDPYA